MHHKMLDRGAVTVREDYEVVVSEQVHGASGFEEWLLDFHGRALRRPERAEYLPVAPVRCPIPLAGPTPHAGQVAAVVVGSVDGEDAVADLSERRFAPTSGRHQTDSLDGLSRTDWTTSPEYASCCSCGRARPMGWGGRYRISVPGSPITSVTRLSDRSPSPGNWTVHCQVTDSSSTELRWHSRVRSLSRTREGEVEGEQTAATADAATHSRCGCGSIGGQRTREQRCAADIT
jgi:hypothetical protein